MSNTAKIQSLEQRLANLENALSRQNGEPPEIPVVFQFPQRLERQPRFRLPLLPASRIFSKDVLEGTRLRATFQHNRIWLANERLVGLLQGFSAMRLTNLSRTQFQKLKPPTNLGNYKPSLADLFAQQTRLFREAVQGAIQRAAEKNRQAGKTRHTNKI